MSCLFHDHHPTALNPYIDTFQAWVKHLGKRGVLRSRAAIEVYEDIWLSFARHANASTPRPPLPIEQLSASTILSFVEGPLGGNRRATTARYIWRVLDLIDRILTHDDLLSSRTPRHDAIAVRDSRPEWKHANARRQETAEHLDGKEASALVRHMLSIKPNLGRTGVTNWQAIRNVAAVGLHLGAGLTPVEIRQLSIASIAPACEPLRESIQVQATSSSPTREAPLSAWAARLLARWLEVREAIDIPPGPVFPSTKSGKPWSKPAHYSAASSVFLEAGWSEESAKGGVYRLRHTFAIRHLQRGVDEATVARWLGLLDVMSMAKYRPLLLATIPEQD